MNNDPQDVVLLDGGTGMELLRRSSDKTPRLWSAQYLLSEPDLVRAVHRDYIHAGARVITINAYSASYTRMEMVGETERVPLMQRRACELALGARDDAGATGAQVKIAGCLPPLNGSYRPDRVRDFETNRAEYERLAALQAPHVDLFLCETLSSADEARAAVSAVAGLGKPVWVAFTLQDEGPALRSGESVDEAVQALSGLGVAAVLLGNGGGVLLGRLHIVHGAGPHDHQQARVIAPQDRLDALARLPHRGRGPLAEGQLAVQQGWCHQRPRVHHMEIGGGDHAGSRRATQGAIHPKSPIAAVATRAQGGGKEQWVSRHSSSGLPDPCAHACANTCANGCQQLPRQLPRRRRGPGRPGGAGPAAHRPPG
jgi:hypothetical protein